MRIPPDERLLPLSAAAGAAAVGPGAANHLVGGETVMIGGAVHFFAVGITALVAAAAAVVLTAAGARRRDGRPVLVGTAFAAMASLLAVHGLATPGMLVGRNGVVAFTGGATLPVGAAILSLAALPALRRPQGVPLLLALQGVLIAGVAALGLLALVLPDLVPSVPRPGSPPALAVLAAGLLFYGLLARRAVRTFLLTRRRADLAVGVGICWLATALVPALTLSYWQLGWWLGHGLELAGMALVAVPVALDLRRASQSRPLAGDLRAADLVAAEEAFLGSHVRALTRRLAEKDEYTEGHTRRVALRAVQVGEELGLPPGRLRALATGGLLHDIGKLSVPDAILKKPTSLTAAEYAVIRRHPDWGYSLLRELGGFSEGVCRLVRDHHERLDGSGYPRGLRADELDLDTRILAVCDVYDALRSPRVYRDPWSREDALAFLRHSSGRQLDPRCVAALERVLAREAPLPSLQESPAAAPLPTGS